MLTGRRRALVVAAAAVVLVANWALPGVLFPNPGVNDAIWLSTLSFLVFLLPLGLALGSLAFSQRWPGVPISLGAYLVGVAGAFGLGLLTFARLDDDRFLVFLIAPALAAAVGALVLVVGIANRRDSGVLLGIVRGGVFAVFTAAWLEIRGARSWLLAPYGLEVMVFIAVAAVLVLLVAADRPRSRA